MLLLLLSSPILISAGLPAEPLLVAAGFVVVSAIQFAARGYLLGARRFSAYANVLALDAVLRVVLAGALALAGALVLTGRLSALAFALALMVAILLAHGPMLRRPLASAPAGREDVRRMRRAVLGLLAGTAAAQVLLNVGPILINAAAVEPGTAGAFQSTFSLARIPLFLLVPLQGAVVAPLAGLVAEGRTARMTGLMLRLAAGIAVVGVVGAGLAWLIGPWAVELVFGAGRSLPGVDVALLVLGVCVHAGLVLTAGALIAAERHGRASVAWVAAVLLFAIGCAALWAPLGPVAAVAVSFLVSSLLGWVLALGELVAVGRRAAAGVPEVQRAE
ncbi:lipopolysaccharide biosynthesis protein [Naasia aerilata]|uniref:Polysaccharide biosynthesis protein n=1 Tax=Naasia aerilata TaxID=1162966 RepID=A0ABM8GCD1_9MICO|nr:hypothetical protein [Naasia aerilata]BDZ45906.1 hypothetical protein GCM10025866_18150 [Naasia aerilata]